MYLVLRASGHPKVEGELKLAGLSAPVRVLRDEIGVPYMFAGNTPDLLRAQGFITAQHRLMQLELFRATWRGELSAAFGDATLPSDIRMRVLGTHRNGERHAVKLGPASRAFFQHYADGVNAYVADHAADHPLELKAAGLVPRAWSVADLVALVHFIHYSHATNFKAEVVAQKLIDKLGAERAREIFPLTLIADAAPAATAAAGPRRTATAVADLGVDWGNLRIVPETLGPQGLGSNNWAVGPSRSASGRAMVANDPHLDNRILPGTWHPVGLFAPGIQAVGAALPGMPGIMVGRTQHVAFGVTNAYGDVQDLYVETVDPADPNRYLDGSTSQPFTEVTETIRVKDKAAPGGFREHPLKLRFTKHGPVISDHPGLGPQGNQLLVLRSTDAEVLAPQIGIEGLLTAPDAAAFDRELQKIDLMMFNFVFADDQGAIGHRATGAVPVRAGADGSVPRRPPADGSDDWTGFIPKDRMPGMLDPARAWVGTANHDARPADYPWYYTNYVAPNYRYRRIGQVLGTAQKMTVADHWQLMADDRNLQSDVLRPRPRGGAEGATAQRDLAGCCRPGTAWTAPTAPHRWFTRRCTANGARHFRRRARRRYRRRHARHLVFLAAAFRRPARRARLDLVRRRGHAEPARDAGRCDPHRGAACQGADRGRAGHRPREVGLGQGAHAAFREPAAAQRRGPGTAGRLQPAAFGQRRNAQPRRLRLRRTLRREFLRLDAAWWSTSPTPTRSKPCWPAA